MLQCTCAVAAVGCECVDTLIACWMMMMILLLLLLLLLILLIIIVAMMMAMMAMMMMMMMMMMMTMIAMIVMITMIKMICPPPISRQDQQEVSKWPEKLNVPGSGLNLLES